VAADDEQRFPPHPQGEPPDEARRVEPRYGTRARAGLLLVPTVFVALWFAPLSLEPRAHHLAAIFTAVVVAWVTEVVPIAVTALLIAPALVAAGVTDAKTAFAPYASPLLFLFVGGFFIARAMTRHGLDRRIAMALVSAPIVGGKPRRVRLAFMLAGALLSMWISNTATTAILLPILLGTFTAETRTTQAGGILAVAYACSIGGLGTLVGSPPNLITADFLDNLEGVRFGFVEWMMVGLPTALVLVVVAYLLSLKLAPPADHGTPITRDRRPWSLGEKVTALAFGIAVVGWMVPGIWEATGSPLGAAIADALPGGAVALIAASVLFLFRTDDGALVLPWNDAAKIDWGIIMLFGGGISLGNQMFDTGLAHAMSVGFVELTGIESLWTLTALVTVFTIFFTEVCSNTASATMLVPLVVAVADELEVSPVPPALAVGLAASCAFMLPIATGPNAIAYGTGKIDLPYMMRTGLWLNLLCALFVFLLLRGMLLLYGWG